MIALLPGFVPGVLLLAVMGLGVLCLFLTRQLQTGYVRLLEENLTVAPALKGHARPELGLSQTFGRMDRSELVKEIAALRRENLLVSGEMTSPFTWFDMPDPSGSTPAPAMPDQASSEAPLPRVGSSDATPLRAESTEGRGSASSDAPRVPAPSPAHAADTRSSRAPEDDIAQARNAERSTPPGATDARDGGPGGARGSSSFPVPVSVPGADYLTAQTAILLSGDLPRLRAALEEPAFDPRLAAHAIVLLANDKIQREAVRTLRRIANRITGQLIDALLDPSAPPHVRRRVARVMSACNTQRAVDGLVEGLLDDSFEVRYQCGLTLLKITQDARNLTVSKDGALAAVRREVDRERKLWQHQPPLAAVEEEGDAPLIDDFLRDRTSRSLQHVFSILALVFEREPMRVALTALAGDDEILRGTALEYLDEVLPADVKAALWPFVTRPQSKERARAGGSGS